MVKKEADAISPFDMMFYSEVTKDMLNIFKDKDSEIA